MPPPDGVMRMTFGKKGFFGYQVARSGEVYWFQNFHRAAEPDRKELDGIPDELWRAKLLGMHEGDRHPIAEIIRSTGGRIGRWPLYEMPTIPKWHDGPVCLIGDAAHVRDLKLLTRASPIEVRTDRAGVALGRSARRRRPG